MFGIEWTTRAVVSAGLQQQHVDKLQTRVHNNTDTISVNFSKQHYVEIDSLRHNNVM